jgi:nucleoside-diphosphate-sugar epimerase
MRYIESEEQLEDRLSAPGSADVEFMRRLKGDIIILGAGGKMGPSLIRLAMRATEAAGVGRRIVAVSRFSAGMIRDEIERLGAVTLICDLSDPAQIVSLPRCDNVIYMAGRKFGSSGRPDLTWIMNVIVPSAVLRHFRSSRIVAFSTGNVYPFLAPDTGGSRETDPPDPVGEYAQSCLGRERVFEYFSREYGTGVTLLRLNYAVDLRYGVLVDIARRVYEGSPVSLTVGYINTIWQGDANSYALRGLTLCESPPRILNVTGPELVPVRMAAEFFAARFRRKAMFEGKETGTALLSNASLCHSLLGLPEIKLDQLMEWVARWIEIGGASLNKPTHFEVTNGKY